MVRLSIAVGLTAAVQVTAIPYRRELHEVIDAVELHLLPHNCCEYVSTEAKRAFAAQVVSCEL
jgi:hypothetical protein